jgi:cell division protein FtsQ
MNSIVMNEAIPEVKSPSVKRRFNDDDKSISRATLSLLFIFLLASLCIFSGWRLMNPATLPIKQVRIEGNFRYLSPDKMQSIVSEVIKGGFFNLNVAIINNALLDEPWVHWVTVQRVWPDGLNVQVKEQAAIAHWNTNSLVNSSAQIFSPEGAAQIKELPFLTGPADTEHLVLNRYQEINSALSEHSIRINSIYLSERRAWRVQLQDGPLVILGRSDLENRIIRFTDSVLSGLGKEISKVKQIDMRYTNGFAVEWNANSSQLIESRLNNNG